VELFVPSITKEKPALCFKTLLITYVEMMRIHNHTDSLYFRKEMTVSDFLTLIKSKKIQFSVPAVDLYTVQKDRALIQHSACEAAVQVQNISMPYLK
jgi:hypothetical protein